MRLIPVLIVGLILWALAIFTIHAALGEDDDDDDRIGRAPLFLLTARFAVADYIASAPKRPHTIALLWDVPRRRRGHLRHALRKTRAEQVELVLLNETCVRNRVCERRDALAFFTETSLARAASRSSVRLKYRVSFEAGRAARYLGPVIANRALIVNPLLETRLRRGQWNRVAGWVRRALGAVPLVWNPLVDDRKPRPRLAYYTERHGLTSTCDPDGRTIANLDGSRCSAMQMRDWLSRTKRCSLSLLWEPADNCRLPSESKFVPPSRRFCFGGFNDIKKALQ